MLDIVRHTIRTWFSWLNPLSLTGPSSSEIREVSLSDLEAPLSVSGNTSNPSRRGETAASVTITLLIGWDIVPRCTATIDDSPKPRGPLKFLVGGKRFCMVNAETPTPHIALSTGAGTPTAFQGRLSLPSSCCTAKELPPSLVLLSFLAR